MFKADFLRDELQRKSIDSIKALVPGKFYSMEYYSDYHLDEALASNPVTMVSAVPSAYSSSICPSSAVRGP